MSLDDFSFLDDDKKKSGLDNFSFVDNSSDDSLTTRIKNDIVNITERYYTGAVQGLNEMVRAQKQQDDQLLSGEMPSWDEMKQASQYTTNAQKQFMQGTLEPVILPASIAFPALAPVAGGLFAGDVINEAREKGVGEAARDATYGPLVDFVTQEDLGQQFYDRPVSTAGNAIMSVVSPLLLGKGAYAGLKRGYRSVNDFVNSSVNKKLDDFDFTKTSDSSDNTTSRTEDTTGDTESGNENNSSFEAFVNAIAGQESGGNYDAVNGRTGAAGKFQIMPENWPEWSEEAGIGRDAPMTPENQEIVARHKLREYYDKYGPRGAAEAWYGGEGAVDWSEAAKNRPQGPNGDEPSVNEYADSVLARMGKYGNVGPSYRSDPGIAPDALSQSDYNLTELPEYNDLMNSLQQIGQKKWDEAELNMNTKSPYDWTNVKNPDKSEYRGNGQGVILGEQNAEEPVKIVLPSQSEPNILGLAAINDIKVKVARDAKEGQERFDYLYKMAEAARAGDYRMASRWAEAAEYPDLAAQYRNMWWHSQGFKDNIADVASAKTHSDVIMDRRNDVQKYTEVVRNQIANDRFNARQGLVNTLDKIGQQKWDNAEIKGVSAGMTPEEKLLTDFMSYYKVSPENLERALQSQYDKMVNDYIPVLRSQMKQGVERRGVNPVLDSSGRGNGDYVSYPGYSKNYQWYKDMLDANGGKFPKKADLEYWLRETAIDHLKNGYTDPLYGEMTRPNADFIKLSDALDGLKQYRKNLRFEPQQWKQGGDIPSDVAEQAVNFGRAVKDQPDIEYRINGSQKTEPITLQTRNNIEPMPDSIPRGNPRPTPSESEPVLSEVSRKQVLDAVKDMFTTVRTGRLGVPGVLGWRNKITGMIRTGKYADFPTIMHEIGHYLDEKYGLRRVGTAFDKEFTSYIKREFGNAYDNIGKNGIHGEAIAEFIQEYTINRRAAQKDFPQFYRHFEQFLKNTPELQGQLQKISGMLHTWYHQAPEARVKGSISFTDDRGVLQKAYDAMKHPRDTAEAVVEKGKTLFDTGYDKIVDQLAPLDRMMKEIEKVTGEKLPDSMNVFKQAWLTRGWMGKAQTLIEHGIPEKGVPALKSIIKIVEKDIKGFSSYVTALREVDAYNLEAKGADKFEHAISKLDAARTVANYRRTHPEFVKAQQALVKYNNHLLDILVDSGLKDKASVEDMKVRWPNYVPFFREFSDAAIEKFLSTKGFGNVPNPIKTFRGSTRDIINPLESIVKNTYQFVNLAERNKVGRLFVDLARKPGLGDLIEKVSGPANTKDSTFAVWDHGMKQVYQTEPELYRAIMLLDREPASGIAKILQMPAGWLRAGATLTPEFIARNPMRDAHDAFIYSKYGFIPGIDTFRGLMHFFKKDDLYWEYMNSGAAHSAMVSLDRDYLTQNLREIMGRTKIQKMVAPFNPKTYLNILRAFSEATEVATRLGEYENARKGYSGILNRLFSDKRTPQTVEQAALGSRDVTLDFSRSGVYGKEANKYIAFWNAAIQGTDKMIREFKQNPVRTASKVFLSITLPSIVLYCMNRNDPRYQELPQWEKDLFWIIPTKDTLIRIPKPFEMGVLFGTSVERLLQWMDKKDPNAFKGFGKTVWDSMMPGWMPTALLPIVEWYSNYSFFMDRNIVSPSQQKLPPAMQYGPNTSSMGKWIGSALNVAPAKVDNTIRDLTGGLGGLVMTATDLASGAFDNRPSLKLSEYPGIRAFTATPYKSSQSVQDFYDTLNEQEQLYNQWKQTGQRPTDFNPAQYQRLKAVDQIMTQLNKQEKAILNNQNMSSEEKRNRLDRLQIMAVNYARIGLGKQKVAQ